MKTISIAMGTYNGAKFIANQLDSLAKQTALPMELVVCDDCSTDSTLGIVRDFAATAPFPVRIEKNEKNLGWRANFMKASALCQGDLIAFCDQDDVWLPEKLATCRAAFDNEDVLLVYHNARVVNEKLEPTGDLDWLAAPQAINPPQTFEPTRNGAGFTCMFRSSLLMFQEYWPESRSHYNPEFPDAHDQWFFFLAAALGTIVYIQKHLALYRQHGKNATRSTAGADTFTKLHVLISNNIGSIIAREISARCRAAILKQAQGRLSGILLERAKTAASRYRKIEACCRMRRELYASGSIPFRSSQIVAVMRAGGYGPRNQWGSGPKALVRDILRGIIFPARAA